MFQDGQLFGHLTVARNVGYALRLRRARDIDDAGRRAARRWSGSRGTPTACPPPCPAASGSGSRWPGRWRCEPAAAAARRAAVRARRRAARAARRRPARHPAGGRHHGADGHPRPRGGVHRGRPARGDARRARSCRTGRSTRCGARPADADDRAVPRLRPGAAAVRRRTGARGGRAAPRPAVGAAALRALRRRRRRPARRDACCPRGSRPSRCGSSVDVDGRRARRRGRAARRHPAPGDVVGSRWTPPGWRSSAGG